MTVEIRELKRRYKTALALGQTLPTPDLAVPLPLSTGHPLYDAALTDKLVVTATLSEAEHLNRAWHLVRQAAPSEQHTLARHAGGLLNDYKLLLGLRAWQDGDEELTRLFLRALPWGWRFAFPTAVIKPAASVFTGWRRSLSFRLVDDPRFPALRLLFRELLAQAPGVAILKYRQTIKEAAALLHFRFEGDREQAIHDLCFNNGRSIAGPPDLEPIGTYLRARQALAAGGAGAFLRVLEDSPHDMPLTGFMGLLGNAGLHLTGTYPPEVEGLRRYTIRCATAIESLLRLNEWSAWLTEADAQALGAKVRHSVIERGLAVPFFKVTKAFMAAPLSVRKLVLDPLYRPLLAHFGRQVTGLLPEPGPLTFVQPGNVIHLMSFLLYTVLSSAMPARLLLLYQDGIEEVPPLDLNEVTGHLADDGREMERWLLAQFGGMTSSYRYTYNYRAAARALGTINPHAPLLLDLPFADSMDLLAALLPFERVFNLNTAFGAPGEICLAYDYYALFTMATPLWQYGLWARYSDSAAQQFAEFLDRLRYFQALAAEVSAGGVA